PCSPTPPRSRWCRAPSTRNPPSRSRIARSISSGGRSAASSASSSFGTRPYGNIMLLASDVTMDPLDVIILYGYRFKIALGFRNWLRTSLPERPQSELDVAHALLTILPEFLGAGPADPVLAKFLRGRLFRPPQPVTQQRAA